MILFEVDIIGDTELIQGLDRLERALESFRIPLREAGQRAAASIGENIVRGGIPDAFAPLAASTLYATPQRLGGPLYNQGDLMEAASRTESGGGSAWEITDDYVVVGLDTDSEIGKIGDILTRGNSANHLPTRPFVRLLQSDTDAITGYFEHYVDQAVDAAFRGY